MPICVLRKMNGMYVIEIPTHEIERQGLRDGQQVSVEIRPVEDASTLPYEIREAFEESWEANKAGYLYLAGRSDDEQRFSNGG